MTNELNQYLYDSISIKMNIISIKNLFIASECVPNKTVNSVGDACIGTEP